MARALGQQLKATWEKLDAERATLKTLWDDIAFYCCPKETDLVTKNNQDDPSSNVPTSSVGIEANRILAGGLFSNTFSLVDPWFTLRSSQPDLNQVDDVARWFTRAGDIVLMEINNSNFPEVLHEALLRLCALGTDVISIEYRNGQLQFASWPITTACLADDPYGQVDTVYRRFEYTARQAAARWGEDKLPQDIANAVKDKGRANESFPFIHAVYPREGVDLRRARRLKSDLKPIASVYFYVDTGDILEESGYDDFPYAAIRFSKAGNKPYGRGPGFDALPALRSLNRKEKDFDDSTELSMAPPSFLPYGVDPSQVDLRPGAMNPVLNPAMPTPIFMNIGTNFKILWQSKEGTEAQVRQLFYNGLFDNLGQLMGSNRMTATEVEARVDEKIQLLMPVACRMQTELYKRVVDRALLLLLKAGKIPQPPDELLQQQSIGFAIRYTNRLVSRMKDVNTARLNEVLQTCISIEAGINQGQATVTRTVFDLVKCERAIAENKGIAPDLLRSEQAIVDLMKAEAQEQQRQAVEQAVVDKLKPVDAQKAAEPGSMMGPDAAQPAQNPFGGGQ